MQWVISIGYVCSRSGGNLIWRVIILVVFVTYYHYLVGLNAYILSSVNILAAVQ